MNLVYYDTIIYCRYLYNLHNNYFNNNRWLYNNNNNNNGDEERSRKIKIPPLYFGGDVS